MYLLNYVKNLLSWLLKMGPLAGYKRQLGILFILLKYLYPQLAVVDIVDGLDDAELLVIWGFIDAEVQRHGVSKKVAEMLSKLIKKITK